MVDVKRHRCRQTTLVFSSSGRSGISTNVTAISLFSRLTVGETSAVITGIVSLGLFLRIDAF